VSGVASGCVQLYGEGGAMDGGRWSKDGPAGPVEETHEARVRARSARVRDGFD